MCEQCHQDDWFCKHKKLEPAKQIKTVYTGIDDFSELDNPLLKLLKNMDKKKIERAKQLVDNIKIRTEQMNRYFQIWETLRTDNLKDLQELEVYWSEKYQTKK